MGIDLFMLADDVPGIHKMDTSGEKPFAGVKKKFIKLETISHSLPRSVSSTPASALQAGVRASCVSHGPIVATRNFDASSPQLLNAHVKGLTLKNVDIFACRVIKIPAKPPLNAESRGPRALMQILMSNVVIAGYDYSLSGATAKETLVLRYVSIGWRLRSIESASGTDEPSSWVESWWDGEKNEAKNPGSKIFHPDRSKTDRVFEDAGFK